MFNLWLDHTSTVNTFQVQGAYRWLLITLSSSPLSLTHQFWSSSWYTLTRNKLLVPWLSGCHQIVITVACTPGNSWQLCVHLTESLWFPALGEQAARGCWLCDCVIRNHWTEASHRAKLDTMNAQCDSGGENVQLDWRFHPTPRILLFVNRWFC